MAEQFDSYTCCLAGQHIVSAGAGTGKTYNIQILALRNILAGIPIEKILVVTFTNLATDELRDRLRKVLENAANVCLMAAAGMTEEELCALAEKDNDVKQVLPCLVNVGSGCSVSPECGIPLEEKTRRIREAILNFDSAPVSTIHGFCSRMLSENAFESCISYGLEMRKSCNALVKSLLCDFMRNFSRHASARRGELLSMLKLTPNEIMKALNRVFSNPGAGVNWSVPKGITCEMIEESDAWTAFADMLQNTKAVDVRVLCERINAASFRTNVKRFWNADNIEYIRSLGKAAFVYAFGNGPENRNNDIIKSICDTRRKDLSEQQAIVSNSGLFRKYLQFSFDIDGHTSLVKLAEQYRMLVLAEGYRYVREKLDARKARDGFITYNDLLVILKQKLNDPLSGSELRKAIRDRFSCVMIDEFQDTDPIQGEIFKSLFTVGDDGAENALSLFMIGDEKQAIYKFRGGDVFNFQEEKRRVESKYPENSHTLSKNFRSSKSFIEAMNDFWSAHPNFFSPPDDFIEMEEINCGKENISLCYEDGTEVEKDKLLSNCVAGDTVAVTAEEINRIMNAGLQKVRIDKEGNRECTDLKYSDIAVLVCSSAVGEKIQKELKARGIPSVFMGGQSIFKVPEARFVLYLLEAVMNPEDTSMAIRFLGWPGFGFSAMDLEFFRNGHMMRFQMYLKKMKELWHSGSFHAMFNEFMNCCLKNCGLEFAESFVLATKQENSSAEVKLSPARLLAKASEDGEYVLSVIRQVAQYLAAEESGRHLGQMALLAFLADKVSRGESSSYDDSEDTVEESGDDSEEYQLGLTTMKDAVRILTVHKSKGLQYPVVIVPDFRTARSDESIYHGKRGERMVRMSDLDEEAAVECVKEGMAENKRLMYVAITRAEYLCRFISRKSKENDLEKKPFLMLPEVEVLFENGEMTSEDLSEKPTLYAQVFNGRVDPGWRTSSFSRIGAVTQKMKEHLPADREEKDDNGDEEENGMGTSGWHDVLPYNEREPIFRFPRGTRTGTCWHEVMENLDMAKWDEGVPEAEREASWKDVVSSLANYGQLPESEQEDRLAAFRQMLIDVCNYPFVFPGSGESIRLCCIEKDSMLRELRFIYRMKKDISGKELKKLLVEDGIGVPNGWDRDVEAVNITGSIDILFRAGNKYFIMDWKTNMLGARKEDFTAEGVEKEVVGRFYSLQCVIYALAFVQFYIGHFHPCSKEDGSDRNELVAEAWEHFGGCADVFLRGFDPETGRGVHYVRPSLQLLQKLDEYMGVITL